jgi:hypothetical protein
MTTSVYEIVLDKSDAYICNLTKLKDAYENEGKTPTEEILKRKRA